MGFHVEIHLFFDLISGFFAAVFGIFQFLLFLDDFFLQEVNSVLDFLFLQEKVSVELCEA